MSWPGPSDYRDSMQHPDRVFKDATLRGCKVETNTMGVPKGRAGGFAIVYKLNGLGGTKALRLFLGPSKEREERYGHVDKHLKGLGQALPRCLVNFGYQHDGYRHGSQWFPIQTLDWVSGETLGVWMAQTVARRNIAGLRKMADLWIELVDGLRAAKIAHGDLQHGNVMVVNEAPKLVDYDCMTVPALVGRVALENGLPAYQHPGRGRQTLSLELDDFAAWIILIALRAAAADLALWDRYVLATGNENLLFTEGDIANHKTSRLWTDLLASPDPDVRIWSKALRESIDQPFDKIPKFEIDFFKPLRAICDAAEPDWDAIWAMATGPGLSGKTIPPALATKIDLARQRVECRDRMKRAIQANRPREIVSAYHASLLDDWKSAAPLVAAARSAREVVAALDVLSAAMKSPGDGRALIALWDQHATRLGGVSDADAARQAAEDWKRRIAASDAFLAVLRGTATERAIAQAWERLEAVGGHPDSAGSRGRAEMASRRAASLDLLRAVPATEDEPTDRKFQAAWDAPLLNPCAEAAPFKPRLVAVADRLSRCNALKAVIAAADSGKGGEQAVIDAAAKLPAGYLPASTARVAAAKQKLTLSAGLDRLLADASASDLAIADAWDKSVAANAKPSEPTKIARCNLAVRRRDLLRQLDAIPPTPVDGADAQWLELWDEALLGGSADAAAHRARAGLARRRTVAWDALNKAVLARDVDRIKTLRADPDLAAHPGLAQLQRDLDEVLRSSLLVDDMLTCLRSGNESRFLALLDLSILSTYGPAFRPHLAKIGEWVQRGLLDPNPLRVANPAFEVQQDGCNALVRWGWGLPKFVGLCIVAAEGTRHLATPDQARNHTLRVSLADHRRAGGGAIVHFPPDEYRLYVTVWPVIELAVGDDRVELTGPPLSAAIVLRDDGPTQFDDDDESDPSWFGRFRNWLSRFGQNV